MFAASPRGISMPFPFSPLSSACISDVMAKACFADFRFTVTFFEFAEAGSRGVRYLFSPCL
jgi:hypothetical protein